MSLIAPVPPDSPSALPPRERRNPPGRTVATSQGAVVRLVVVEDSELDFELLLAGLARDGLRVQAHRVEDEEGLREALAGQAVDAVVTDHNLPRFDSFSALRVARQFDGDMPLIVVSGEMAEDLAVAALHAGADDFILKSRLFRLAPALRRSLQAAEDRRHRRASAAALADSERRLHALTQHLEAVREDERRHLARELHDDVGTTLTAIKFELVRLQRALAGRPEDGARVASALDLLSHVVAASHRIQHRLRPPVLDAGLVAALAWLASSTAARAELRVRFESNRDEIDLGAERAAAVYRVAQESLNNALKHAQASEVSIQLFASADEVTLEVSDNGVGFETRMLAATPGFGLRGLIERARGLNGWAELSSAPGRGTTVMFSIPRTGEESLAQSAPAAHSAPAATEDPWRCA